MVFSSIAGSISHATLGNVDYESGVIIGLASLIGVYIGIFLKDAVSVHLQRRLLISFYFIVVAYLIQRIFLGWY